MDAGVVGCVAYLMLVTRNSKWKATFLLWGVAALALNVGTVQAQSNANDEQLAAAERALLEGLASKGAGAFDADVSKPASAQPELQPATYSGPVVQQDAQRSAPVQVKQDVEEGDLSVQQELAPKRVVQAPETGRVHEEVPQPQVVVAPVAAGANAAMKRELEASQKRVAELERQLEEVKGQLTMAETELSRLATISEARNRASFGRLPEPSAAVVQPANQPKARFAAPAIEPTPSGSADLTIATVDVEKAELRLGPGKNHSALMTVAKGSRLAVEARQGEWLRVFAPNGQRAWILSKLVTFGSKTSSKNTTSTVRVHGYSSSLEDEAFKRVQAMTAGR